MKTMLILFTSYAEKEVLSLGLIVCHESSSYKFNAHPAIGLVLDAPFFFVYMVNCLFEMPY